MISRDSKKIQINYIENENELISYGKLLPEELEGEVTAKIKKIPKKLSIQAKCTKSEIYPEDKPRLIICCKKTRYSIILVPNDIKNNRYIYKIEVPLSFIHKLMECKFVICNENFDIIQQSVSFEIRLEDDLEEEFPPIRWVNFDEHHPSIRNLYWYIRAELDNPIIINFNEKKKDFYDFIYTKPKSQFREEFLRHFRQAYIIALFFDISKLTNETLQENLDPDNKYHERASGLLLRSDITDENLWYRFSFLMQETTGIREEYDTLLKAESGEKK